jgi:glucose-6-phosphate isomerase
MSQLTKSATWQALQSHHKTLARIEMRELFQQEPGRFERFSLKVGDVFADFSKNRITTRTMTLLLELAREADLESWIERLMRGERINNTEGRAASHVALRNRVNRPITIDGADVMPAVNEQLARMQSFVEAIRAGTWTGASGQPITDVVSIGIGGSYLGPQMATQALQSFAKDGPRLHFVANVDGAELSDVLAGLNPAKTMFIAISKTFTTAETMMNAATAKAWLVAGGGDTARQFAAVTGNRDAAIAFGIDAGAIFEIWDWVGGRFSLWSAVGLPIALAVGFDRFAELLDGAHAMDEHFRLAPHPQNLPVVLALIGLWYVNFFGAGSRAVIPYDRRLRRLPAYLQQLEMESNGKQVARDGEAIDHLTAPVIWGEPGTDGQHAFFQALHQGRQMVPVDFLVAAEGDGPPDHHDMLIANCLAQGEALMRGRTADEVRRDLERQGKGKAEIDPLLPHLVMAGNRPSNTLLYRRLDPHTLGMLIALYEHKTFVQAAIWRLNPFDQWGVELGKKLADGILPELSGQAPAGAHDSSTAGLIDYLRKLRTGPT